MHEYTTGKVRGHMMACDEYLKLTAECVEALFAEGRVRFKPEELARIRANSKNIKAHLRRIDASLKQFEGIALPKKECKTNSKATAVKLHVQSTTTG